jgi:hypothetical protein
VRTRTLPPATGPADDFLSGASGTVGGRRGTLLRAQDALLDVRTAPRRAALRARSRHAPPRRRVLVTAIVRDDVPGLWPAAAAELRRSRHDVVLATDAPRGRGKFEALQDGLDRLDLGRFDWLVVCDDDVALPRGFLDVLLLCAEHGGLRLAQPAHRLHGHAAWPVTLRDPRADLRTTTFVEIGPVTAFAAETFETLLPFPRELPMGWGLDVHWAALAAQHGWPIGVVDAAPVGHTLRPVGGTYDRGPALQAARAFLAGRPYVRRGEVRTLGQHRIP